jgi:hypothetical protein
MRKTAEENLYIVTTNGPHICVVLAETPLKAEKKAKKQIESMGYDVDYFGAELATEYFRTYKDVTDGVLVLETVDG